MNNQERANVSNEDQNALILSQNDHHLDTDSDNDINYEEDFDAVRSMN